MLPQDLFVPGLASFLLGHIAYIVGLLVRRHLGRRAAGRGRPSSPSLAPSLGLRIAGRGAPGRRARARSARSLAYMAVISAMVVSASATGQPLAMAGALARSTPATRLIAWTRFIQDHPWGRVAVIVTYHLAQVGLVLSLV